MFRHPMRAERHRVDLVRRQHQRRQIEAAFQHIADTRFAADRHALAHQSGNVAIDGSFGGLQFLGNRVGRHRLPGAAEDLDDLEQAVGFAHRLIFYCHAADIMLSAAWQ